MRLLEIDEGLTWVELGFGILRQSCSLWRHSTLSGYVAVIMWRTSVPSNNYTEQFEKQKKGMGDQFGMKVEHLMDSSESGEILHGLQWPQPMNTFDIPPHAPYVQKISLPNPCLDTHLPSQTYLSSQDLFGCTRSSPRSGGWGYTGLPTGEQFTCSGDDELDAILHQAIHVVPSP